MKKLHYICLLWILVFGLMTIGCDDARVNDGDCSSNIDSFNVEGGKGFHFKYEVIDPNAMGRTAIGDIDGDGYNDVVVHTWGSNRGQVSDGRLVWYRYPGWTKLVIRQDVNYFGDGVVIADLDGDGDNDVVTSRGDDKSAQVWWYENLGDSTTSSWIEHNIGTVETNSEVKDIEVHDMDHDDKLDIVVRTKHKVAIYFQDNTDSWVAKMINTREREGMAVGDVDGDGDYDIVLNGFWLENPRDTRNHNWSEYTIDDQWYTDNTGGWQDYSVMVDVKDINGDSKADVVFSHPEKPGFNVTWYECDNPRGGQRSWTKHEVAVVDYCHTLCALDMDLDGDIDIVAGTLKRASNPKVLVFLNDKGDGLHWTIVEVDTKSAYKGKTGDIDNDGDFDIVSAMSWENAPIQLWRNTTNPALTLPLDQWERHLVDGAMPYNAVFIAAGDLDGDKLTDLAAGAWWWKNPGSLDATWTRYKIGWPLNNMAVLHDFDCDGDLDIFGTQGTGAGLNHNFAWARNDGSGNFNILTNISTGGSGDFLQGRLVDNFGSSSSEQVVFSWHNGGGGVQSLEIPGDPSKIKWTFSTLCPVTMKEDLSKGDIDRDGDIDILLGTKWMRNEGRNWTAFTLGRVTDLDSDAEPDRNDLADINGDGRLDAVIAMENGTQILWFEAPSDPTTSWTRHIIGNVDGQGFSMDVADFDGDGDPDVVVGEHRGHTSNRVILFENRRKGFQWTRYVIDTDSKETIDHHNGTQAVDIDGDGDLDLISIGWYNKKVWIYENKGG